MKQEFNREIFNELLKTAEVPNFVNLDYVFNVCQVAFNSINAVNENANYNNEIDLFALLNYAFGEYVYYFPHHDEEKQKQYHNESFLLSMASIVTDKYVSSDLFGQKRVRFDSRFSPSISTLEVYLNFMGHFLEHFEGDGSNIIMIRDLLKKSVSISRAILEMMVRGYDTEAMIMYRTLHECECTLIVFDKYPVSIDEYFKHMRYSIAYKGGYEKEKTDLIFEEIKEEMRKHELKSKDTKKFIEYGWMYSISEFDISKEYKLNFRNGIEALASLDSYSKIYEQSSELIHATPSLIYSNKFYYHKLVLVTMYETFLHLEDIFHKYFINALKDDDKINYQKMRETYLPQAVSIHNKELREFQEYDNN